MANIVKSKYISFHTKDYWEKRNEEDYNDAKFEQMYASSPGRMTPEQVKAHGYDIARCRMWSQYIDTKYNSLWCNEVAMAEIVAEKIENAIKENYPNLQTKTTNGEVKKYGDNKVRFPKIYVGDEKAHLVIVPKLDDTDNNYVNVTYVIENEEGEFIVDMARSMDDIQMMQEVEKFDNYLSTKILPKFGVDKVYHKVENQFGIWSGDKEIGLYDVSMVNLYHTLAKEVNKEYGTNFPYSEKCIKKLFKQNTFGNISYIGGFYLKYPHNDHADLHSYYYYLDDKTKKPDFRCVTTYGTWKKEELIHLLEVLKPYVMSNYFYVMSKKKMTKKYADYDKIGVRYSNKPEYFDVLLWED